jgi:phage/plasmid-like protein (TIGR03299 family)
MATPVFAINDDLSWKIEHRPLYFTGNDGQPVAWPDKVAVVREDTGRCLGVVSKDFETVQNSDLLSLIQPLVAEGLLTVENTGYLNHGSRVFAQAKVNQEYTVLGEDYNGYVTLLNGHVGNCAVAIGSSMFRVICGNTFTAAYSDISEKYRHSTGVTQRVLESQFVLDYVNGAMAKYAEYMQPLALTSCSSTQFRQALEAIYEKPVKDMRESFVAKLDDLFYNGAGNNGNSFYDAFNAVTDYNSHESRKTESGRFNYTNFGQGARIAQRAVAVLTEMAAC